MKSIFITGASKGIGKATAIHFANKGWFVAATDVDDAALAQLAEELKDKKIFTAHLDVTNEQEVKSTLDSFCALTDGKLDVMLNNAGVAWIGNFEEIPLKQQHLTIDVNTKGVLNGAYHAFKYLKATKGSRLISMCSAASHYGVPFEVAYSASKFFVKGMTESLNLEWERYEIHVCDIMPNFVKTPMMENITSSVVENVGIKLTTKDVVEKIWEATQKNKIHWLVEFFPYNILHPLSTITPPFIVRSMVKKTANL